MKKPFLFTTFAAAVLLSTVACDQQQRTETQSTATQAADKSTAAMETATDKTKDAAKDAGQTMENGGLTTKVKAKLAADVKLSTLTSIDVDSNGSTVTLLGHVPSSQIKKQAETVAKSVDGVAKVENKLTIEK